MKTLLNIIAVVALLFPGRIAAENPVGTCPFTPSELERQINYHEDPATHDITFIFDPTTWQCSADTITSVYVSATYNSWSGTTRKSSQLVYDADKNLFFKEVPYNTVKRPANIGQPEYIFMVNGAKATLRTDFPDDYLNGKHMMVIFSFDDIEQIREAKAMQNTIKSLANFDLTTRAGQEALSNYRTVPGTDLLRRSYHPFAYSGHPDMTTEPVRLHLVDSLASVDGVKADICLSGNQTGDLKKYRVNTVVYDETIPSYYQCIIDNGLVLYLGEDYKIPSYGDVYYKNTADDFGRWVHDIVAFINDTSTPVPISIHCRLGTDRTGVFSAIIAALCDAPWDDIVDDYSKSNRMGIGQYRSPKLLKYAFENMLDVDNLDDVADLSQAVKDHFVDNGYLTTDDIAHLKAKLNDLPTESDLTVNTDRLVVAQQGSSLTFTGVANATVYNLAGSIVYAGAPTTLSLAPGIYIVSSGSSKAKIAIL